MVRLRREIEGIRVDLAVPVPAYAQHPEAAAAILPGLSPHIDGLSAGGVLLAGATTAALTNHLADAGHTVTVCDVAKHDVRALHGALSQQAGSRVTIVDKPYGDAGFGPSSFDAIIHLDNMHRFARPAWAVAKMYRELKFDALLIARMLVTGPAPEGVDGAAGRVSDPYVAATVRRLRRAYTGSGAAMVLDADGRDAIDRGAHLGEREFAGDWLQTMAAITEKLAPEQMLAGHSQRLRLVRMMYGARAPVLEVLRRLAPRAPELADDADLASGRPRVVGVVARKLLGGRAFGR